MNFKMKKWFPGVIIALGSFVVGCGSSIPANTVHSADDMVGKQIGVQLGTTGDIFASDFADENSGTGTEVVRYSKGADAVLALRQGKIDAVVIDKQPAEAFIGENEGLMILDEDFAEESYAIVIAKGNLELLDKVNRALAQLQGDGTLQAIIDNYIGVDAPGTPFPLSDDADHSNGVLTMATNATFPPFEFFDENQNIVGIDIDIARAIAAKLSMELRIEDMEFDAIIAAVNSGKADIGVSAMTVTEDRKQNVEFSDTYVTSSQVIIVRKQ